MRDALRARDAHSPPSSPSSACVATATCGRPAPSPSPSPSPTLSPAATAHMRPSGEHRSRSIREATSASRATPERQQPAEHSPSPSTAAVHSVIEAPELDAAHERHILQLIGAAVARKKKQHAGVPINLLGYTHFSIVFIWTSKFVRICTRTYTNNVHFKMIRGITQLFLLLKNPVNC